MWILGKFPWCVILLIYWLLIQTCYGAIWRTEDAFIIDDDVNEGSNESSTTETPNACVDSTGAQGQCVLVQDCYPFYDYFSSPNRTVEVGIFNNYLNISDEPCEPPEEKRDDTMYVCCTSLRYAKVRSISFKEYLEKGGDTSDDNVTIPEIPVADSSNIDTLKIINPVPAGIGEFPFTVAITLNGRQFYGGSLIDSQWVLSAAHCFDKFNSASVAKLIIKVGDHNLQSTGEAQHQDIAVKKLLLHPGFFRGPQYFKDDIALVRLAIPVTGAGFAKAVSLHTGTPDIRTQFWEATVSGWGKTCQTCSTSPVLNKAKLAIVQNQRCSEIYSSTAAPPITENMLCAGGKGTSDACQGDSGGPLVIYGGGRSVLQAGLTSWGIGCGQYPGVYTRVSSYGQWIRKHKQRTV